MTCSGALLSACWQQEILRERTENKIEVVGLGFFNQVQRMGSCGFKGTGGDKAAGVPGRDACSEHVKAHGANTTDFPFNSLGWTVACKFLLILESSCPSGSWRKGTQSPCPSDWGALGSPWLCRYREEGCASVAVARGWDGWAVLVGESDFW